MKYFIFCFLVIVLPIKINAQATRVAILDFENMSGIAKYDGLGKAMSSMLISDIELNVSPKRLQLVERAQIQKILKEQSFQVSGSVDKNTAVQAGKILGVSYLLVGDVYILDDQLIINARLTNAETGDIIFSKKQEGKTVAWLTLKTVIAKELATSLSQPFIEPSIPDKETNFATISTFANAVVAIDTGDLKKSENLIETIREYNPDFKYIEDLTKEIEEIKMRLDKVEQDIETTTTDPINAAKNYDLLGDYKEAERFYQIGLRRLSKNQFGQYLLYYYLLSEMSFKYQDYEKTLYYCNMILEMYSLFDYAVILKAESLLKLKREKEFIEWSKQYLEKADDFDSPEIFYSELENFKLKNEIEILEPSDITYKIGNGRSFIISNGLYNYTQGGGISVNYLLGKFTEINTMINGLNSTLNYLKDFNSILRINKYYFEKTKPYYLPKSRYTSNVSNTKDQLVIAKTGELYIGAYFNSYDGTSWSKGNPNECPCYKLLPKSEYNKLNNTFIKKYWQISTFQSEGWYSLLNRETVNARKRFGQIIYYQVHQNAREHDLHAFINLAVMDLDLMKIDGFQGLIDILDRESIKYDGKENLKFIEQLFKSGIAFNSDDLCNNILNYGHTFLVEGKYEEALKIYKYFNPDYTLKSFGLSIRQILLQDLSEFETKGLISKKVSELTIKNINM